MPTITGAKAEHRLPLKARDVHAFAASLAAAVGVAGAGGGAALGGEAPKWISAIAADLQAHRGRSVVVAGDKQPAAVHALARAMNEALGNAGTTVLVRRAGRRVTGGRRGVDRRAGRRHERAARSTRS